MPSDYSIAQLHCPDPVPFEAFDSAVAATDRLIELYRRNTGFVRELFHEVVGGRELSGRVRAYYPAIRIGVQTYDPIDSRLSYGHVAEPGEYQTTITQPHLFRDYLIEQIGLLLQNHRVPVEVGESDMPIPLHFAFPDGTYVEGEHIENLRRPLRDLFDVPDLAVTDDAIVNGSWRGQPGEPRPLAPFTATRVDYSLHRLQHYTATAPTHFQNFVLFTNYQFYVDEFCVWARGLMASGGGDYDALIDHPVEMGTPQVIGFQAHGAEHELVFTGVAPRLDLARIAADVQRICETQIAFFEPRSKQAPFLDSASRYVFMTMVTGDGYGGLEHRASTALMASRKDLPVLGQQGQGEGYRGFLGLVSHEYFHTWNVKRIKPAAFAPYDLERPDLTRLLWVFEGFTSYYDDLLLLRSQTITRNDYLRLLGKTISGVARAPGRHKQSVAESSFDAWTRYYKQDENSPNALVSYYTKGSLVALGLDLLIRRDSGGVHSLDDVMRLLWRRYGRDFYRGRPQGLAEDALPTLIREATGVDARRFIARHAHG
ncbi:hypothetical protein OMF49_11540, partial [Bordetella pertussis]